MYDRNREKQELDFELEHAGVKAAQEVVDEQKLLTCLGEMVDKSLFSDDELLTELKKLTQHVKSVGANHRKLISELKELDKKVDTRSWWLEFYYGICNGHLTEGESLRTLSNWHHGILNDIDNLLEFDEIRGISHLSREVCVALKRLDCQRRYERFMRPFEDRLTELMHSSLVRSSYVEPIYHCEMEIPKLLDALSFFAGDEETAQAIPDMVYGCVRKDGQEGEILELDEWNTSTIPWSAWYSLFHKNHRYSCLRNSLVRKIVSHLSDTSFVMKLLDFDDWACSISGQVPLRQLIENHLNEE